MNLSDLAAKGAKPARLPAHARAAEGASATTGSRRFARGLGADADRFGCPLFGGDTDRTPGPITISIAAFGIVPHGKMVRRTGARPGDRVLVTGTIGDAALGLLLRQRWQECAGAGDSVRAKSGISPRRYLVPEPRNAIAEVLRAHASAAMDVSDGLVGDLDEALPRLRRHRRDRCGARAAVAGGARGARRASPR